jgi:hypothetical protein
VIALSDLEVILPEHCRFTSRPPATGTITLRCDPEAALSTAQAIRDIKAISGLPWEQVAALFERKVRTVHLWADGRGTDVLTEACIRRVHAVIIKARGASPVTNRLFLLSVLQDGEMAVDLLRRGAYKMVERGLEEHLASARSHALSQAGDDSSVPTPLPPAVLMTANPELGPSTPERVTRAKVKFRTEA